MEVDFRAAVEGTILIGALLATESAGQETYPETVAAVALALVLYVIAHTYAAFAGDRLRTEEPLSLAGLRRAAASEAWLLPGAGIPLVAVLICWAIGASLSAAVIAAVWTSAGMLVVLELVAGIRAGESGRDLAREVCVGALLGALVMVVRIVLH
ncbi:MAG: hypothetical protein JO130_03060 [Solirubrobacterales bacterium]|nr:hypothetical protein [Solirubrobacterales bacterium]